MLLVALGFCLPAIAAASNSFQSVETETLDEEDFVFPQDIDAAKLNIVMLAMSKEQDNGSWQGDELVDWYGALDKAGVLTADVKAWHFSVMKVPFFVKGLIRGGMADNYKGKLPLNQSAAIFVKDIDKFAATPGIALDGQPTIVLVSPQGELLQSFKGSVTDERLATISVAVESYLAAAQSSAVDGAN